MCGINQTTYGYVKYNNDKYSFTRDVSSEEIISLAACVLECKVKRYDTVFSGVNDVSKYLSMKLSKYEREVFLILHLSSKHQLIATEKLFYGTIDSAQVHPREIIKRVLHHNSAAIILAHNHPSSITSPSESDKQITKRISEVCTMVGVRVLDHFIIGTGLESFSFKAGGLEEYLKAE